MKTSWVFIKMTFDKYGSCEKIYEKFESHTRIILDYVSRKHYQRLIMH